MPNQILEDRIQLTTQKTKDRLTIPLLPQAREILNLHKDKYITALPTISNQKTNEYLKELGKLAELTAPVTVIQYFGSKRDEQTYPKHEKLSTHIARKTFVTLALEKGMRPETIMKITGHKDFKAMKPYIKLVDQQVKDELFEAWG